MAGNSCPMTATTDNNNETTKNISYLNLAEISAPIPKVESYDYGNSACFDSSSSTLPMQVYVQNCDSNDQLSPISKPIQVSDFSITSSQDVSGLSTSSALGLENSYSMWSGINGGFKEEEAGVFPHDDNFLNGFEFQEDTRDLAPVFLGNSPLGYFAG
jgi:hypothetical protein